MYGIGPAFARKLVDERNIKSIADLNANVDLLNDKQRIGLKYLREFEMRIPRAEVQRMEKLLRQEAHALVCACACCVIVCAHVCGCPHPFLSSDVLQDPRIQVTVCGSYRRELPDCGDVDVMITHPDFVRCGH